MTRRCEEIIGIVLSPVFVLPTCFGSHCESRRSILCLLEIDVRPVQECGVVWNGDVTDSILISRLKNFCAQFWAVFPDTWWTLDLVAFKKFLTLNFKWLKGLSAQIETIFFCNLLFCFKHEGLLVCFLVEKTTEGYLRVRDFVGSF